MSQNNLTMATLVHDCPRCGTQQITFDAYACNHFATPYGWQKHYEMFSVCRHCHRGTIFVLALDEPSGPSMEDAMQHARVLNDFYTVKEYISLKDAAAEEPPEYLPPAINAAFKEGATCLAVNCVNAGATMFRLCVDHATKALLPDDEVDGLTAKIRWSLGLRLKWLFETNR